MTIDLLGGNNSKIVCIMLDGYHYSCASWKLIYRHFGNIMIDLFAQILLILLSVNHWECFKWEKIVYLRARDFLKHASIRPSFDLAWKRWKYITKMKWSKLASMMSDRTLIMFLVADDPALFCFIFTDKNTGEMRLRRYLLFDWRNLQSKKLKCAFTMKQPS